MGKKSTKKKRKQKIFIEPLEQRIMLDGAGASTFLDLIDESSQSDNLNKTIYEVKKFKEIKSEDGSKELPFTNVPRDQLKRKQIVFIDKQVPDYEKLAKSFRKNVEIHFIETNEDGFKKIEQTLENGKKYSAIHIIGHGSAGQILFGNALLTNESIENYKSTLSNIGESLTQKGDILFYGCNIAANDKGEALLKKISNITKADIAASDDLTGKGGDWELEKKIGIIETRNVQVVDYNDDLLQTGIISINSNTVEKPNATNFTASGQKASGKFIVTLEKENITFSHKITQSSSTNLAFSTRPPVDKLYITNTSGGYQVSSSNPVNSYLFFLNDKTSARKSGQAGSITFASDHQIVGVFAQGFKTVANTTYSKSGATYQAFMDTEVTNRGRDVETSSNGNNYAGVLDSVTSKHKRGRLGDWWEVTNGNRTITFGATNATPGDFIRIITKAPAQENNAPTTDGDSGSVNENSFNVTQNLMNHSSDADDDTLYVSSFDYVDDDGNTTSHTSVPSTAENTWKGVGTKYGIFRILNGTNGPHWNFLAAYPASTNYDADMGSWLSNYSSIGATETQWNNVNALDPGETVTETINYTISDGNGGTATGTITITVTGQNDTPIAVDDVNSVNEGATISTRGNPTRDGVVANDTDVDGDDTVSTFTVNKIKAGYGEHLINRASPVMDPTTVFGTYGTLYMYQDGSYTYSANSEIAGLEEGETVNDVFTYAIKDNSNESELGNIGNTSDYVPDDKNSIGTLTITINGIGSVNNAPVATDDYDSVAEDATITRSSTASGTSNLIVDDTDADGDDISVVNVRVYTAPDPFSSAPAWNSVSAGSDYNTNYREIIGTYGTLRVGADGTYTYAADQDAADPLDPENPDFEYDTFEIQISDTEATSTSILRIYVTGVNDTPVGVDNTDAVTYGSTLSRSNGSIYDILTNDTDIDGDDNSSNFSVTSITPDGGSAQTTFTGNTESVTGSYGVLVLNSNGSYTYTPNDTTSRNLANGATADDVFTYTVSDNSGGTHTTATLTITVTGKTPNPLNDTAYVAAGGSISVANDDDVGVDPGGDGINADGDHSGDVLENDSGTSNTVTAIENSDSETGTIGSVLSGIYGDLTINEDGSYTYEANNASSIGDTTATDVFTYTVTDGATGTTATATITITVEGTDDAPTATNDTGYIYENSTLSVTTDSEGAGEFGTDDDNNNESGDFSGNVMTNDEDPEGSEITVTSIRHTGGTLAGSAISSDEDADTSTTRTDITASTTYANGSSVTGDYGTLTIGADGSYTYAANSANELDAGDIGTDIFTYTVSDGSLPDTATLTITVEGINDAPVAQDDYGFIDENSTLTVSDGDNATTDTTTTNLASKTLTTGSTTGDLYGTDLRFNNDGTKLYILGLNRNKIFQYSLGTDYDISTINATAGVVISDAISGLGNGFTFNNDGSKLFAITGTTISEYSLSTEFDISTLNETASDTFDTSIAGLRGMSFNSDGTKLLISRFHATDSLDVVQFTLGTGYDLSSINYDGGVALDIYNIRGLALSGDGTKMFVSNQGNGRINQYSLATAFSINDGVTYDGEFTANVTSMRGLTFNDDGSKIYYIDMLGNNQIKSYVLGENYRVWNFANSGATGESTGDLINTSSSTQTDSDKDGSASLTISAIRTGTEAAGTGNPGSVGSSLTGTYGTLTIQSTGAYEYVANTDAAEALDVGDTVYDYFTYTISDETDTDTAQLTITIFGQNDNPDAQNDVGVINENGTLPVSGNANVTGSYDASGEYSGNVISTSSSSHEDTDVDDSASLTINSIETGSEVTGSPDGTVGDSLTGTYGDLTLNSDGTYTYVANNAEALDAGDSVEDVFTYTLTDSISGTTPAATITITILGANDAPTTSDATVYINENNQVSSSGDRTPQNISKQFAVSDFSFSDADADDTSFSSIKITSLASTGTLEYSEDGASWSAVTLNQIIDYSDINSGYLRFTPDANTETDATFDFAVGDGTTYSDSSTITVNVNAAPLITDSTVSPNVVDAGGVSSGDVNDNISDSDDTTFYVVAAKAGTETTTYSDISNLDDANNVVDSGTDSSNGLSVSGTYGTLVIGADGTYLYTANDNSLFSSVTDTFTFAVRDNENDQDYDAGVVGNQNAGSYAYDVGTLTFTIVPAINITNDTGYTDEDNDLIVVDNDPGNGSNASAGDHTGDVLLNDTITGGDILEVTSYSHASATDASGNSVSSGSGSDGTAGTSSVVGYYGTLDLEETGDYTYTPNATAQYLSAGQTVTDVFNYTAQGVVQTQYSAQGTITITVEGVNDAPTSSNSTVYINENNQASSAGDRTPSNITYAFSSSDFAFSDDDSGAAITHVKIITLPENGTLSYDTTDLEAGDLEYEIAIGDIGKLVYTPDANSESDDSFTFKVSDGTDYSADANTINVSINAAPNVSDVTHAGNVAAGATTSSADIHGVINSIDVVVDSDDADSVLVVTGVAAGNEATNSTIITNDTGVGSAVSGTYGSLTVAADGTYTYTASPTNSISYGATDTDTFTFTTRDDEGSAGSAGSHAYDVGTITFTVSAHANVAPTSVDGTIYINENNEEASAGDRTDENITYSFSTTDWPITDSNPGQTLSYKILSLPTGGSLALTGSGAVNVNDTITEDNITNLVYTPAANSANSDSFTFSVYDGVTESTSYTMNININAAPNAQDISVSSTVSPNGTSSGDVMDSVTDTGDTLTIIAAKSDTAEVNDYTTVENLGDNANQVTAGTTSSNGLSVSGTYGTLVIGADGTYTYTADATNSIDYGTTDTDVFIFTVKDDEGTSGNAGSDAHDVGTLTFRIGSSVSPTADTDTVDEDGTVTVLNGADEDVLTNDGSDDDLGALTVDTVTSVNEPSNSGLAGSGVTGQYGTLTMAADGSYVYVADGADEDTLTAGQEVTDVFTYLTNSGAESTLTITITGLGPLAAADTASVNENATVTGDGYSDDTTNDGVIENDDDGGASYESEHTSLRVTRVSTDNFSSDIETVADNDDGQTIDGTYGTLTIYRDGEYSYTADSDAAEALDDSATATETFYYEIKDDNDVNASTTTLTITITGVNDDIVAVDDTDEVDEGSNVLRGNTSAYSLDYDDLDVDTADTYSTHEITVIRTKNEAALDGTYGTIATPLEGDYGRLTVFADGSYNYQANNNIMISGSRMVSGQSVTDVFTYTVADGNGSTDTAILTITINGTDEPPIAEDDYTTVNVEDGSVTVNSGSGVSVNDADIEGDITVTGIENSSGNTGTIGSPLSGNYGNLVLNTDGSYTYTIDTSNTEINKIPEGGSFIEEFTYTITDEAGQTTTATIFIKINGKNDAPEAVDDTDELDLNTTTSVSRDLGSDYVVTSDDNDIDLNDYVYIQSFRTGQSSGSGTSGTLNSSLSGTYGSLNLSTDGTYTYVSNSGLVDTLDPGQSIYDYFTYTISDSQGATAYAQLTIRLYGPEAEAETETETEIDHRDLDSSFRNLVQRASLTGKDPYELPEIVPSLSTNFYEGQFKIATFSENLKLVDLRAQFKDKDGNYTTFSDGSPDDILVLQFSVFNDPGIELVRYKGEMKDGSALPSWIKVNPKSGVVVTEIPPDVDLLEFKVIGIDEKNNEYEIAVVIDAGELRQNRELAKEFAGEIDENISVNEDGDVEVQSDEEQTNNETENKSLNGNEVKIKSKKQINEFVKGDVFKPKPYLRDNKYIINLPDEIKDNLEKGIAVLRNGEKAPKWVKVNLNKGELILDPPKNLKNLDLKIITMDQEGNKISNEIKSKINKRSAERFAKQVEIKEQSKFVSLNDQVGNEKLQFDNYGEDILRRL